MSRAEWLIETLEMTPHPEGGHFREVYRSPAIVRAAGSAADRSALTSIYFLLARGGVSTWHRVASDEVWHFYEGDPLELTTVNPDFGALKRETLGPVGEGSAPVRVVPADHWQTARTTGDYTLVGCTVGPGFEFEDFELLRDQPENAGVLRRLHPELVAFL